MKKNILAATLLLVGFTASLAAQQHPAIDRGLSPDKVFYLTELDQVNTMNGALSVRIGLGISYPGNASFSYGPLALTYNMKAWDFEEVLNPVSPDPPLLVRSLPAQHNNAGHGWVLNLAKLIPPDDPSNETPRWQLLDSSGGRSSFHTTLHPNDAVTAGVSYTRDSRYARMTEIAGQRQVELRGGEILTFASDGRLVEREDRFGNYLRVSYPDATRWVLTDRQARTHTVYFKSATSDGQTISVVDRIEMSASGGTTATTTFEYTSAMISPACTDTYHTLGAQIEVPLLERVLLPDGSKFEMTYLGGGGCANGLLESLTLPTLGRVEYGYGTVELPTNGCDLGSSQTWAQRTNAITSRTLFDPAGTELGSWGYSYSLMGPPDEPSGTCTGTNLDPSEVSRTIVTKPDGTQVYNYFSVWPNFIPPASPNGFKVEEYGMPYDLTQPDATGTRFLSTEVYESGVLKRSNYVYYEYENDCAGDPGTEICSEANRRLVSQRTVFHDSGHYADVDFSDFDGLGHHRTVTTGGNYPSGNVKVTTTNYNPGHTLTLDTNFQAEPGFVMWPTTEPWVLDTYTEQTVAEGTQTIKTQACFDADTGALERTRALKGSVPNKNDVLASFTRDTFGNLQLEEYYGGDLQDVSTSSDLCTLTLPSASQYRKRHTYTSGTLSASRYQNANGTSVGFLTTDLTIDADTGLASASRDTAGIETAFEYDSLGRLLWEKPEAGHGAWVQYGYDQATSSTSLAAIRILHRVNGSKTGTILRQEELHFDGFGRVAKVRKLLPGIGWVVQETDYDAQGRRTAIAEWADEDAVPFVQHRTQFLNYDAFGRPGTIRPPDGSAHDVTMTYSGDHEVQRTVKIATSSAGESSSVTTERYDRQGRLYEVVEPSGAGNASVTTSYGYDAADRLVSVTTTADGVTQIRQFNYNNLGNLTSEKHPEKDGPVTYSDYDALGHAGRKIDGSSDFAFTWDRAERVTEIREGSGDERPLKSFEYSTTVAANDWRKGKLQRATRYNYYLVDPPQPPDLIFADGFECGDTSAWNGGGGCPPDPIAYTVEVEETYVYGGVGGRVSQRDTAITLNGNTGETFTQGWSYNDLGDVATVDYPVCDFTRCTTDGGGLQRSVATTYTRGFPTAVPGYVTSITYHPSHLVHKITHDNNVVVTHAADPNGMARPASIEAKKGTTTHWTTGTYQYDGAGNVSSIGGSDFVYDKVSRLTRAVVSKSNLGTGSLVQRDYTYDSFGNLQNIAGSPGRATPTDSATNRLQGTATYSAAGSLTSWNGNTYEYDAFQMMTRMISGEENWLYVYTADDERIWQFRLSATSNFSRYTLRDLSAQVLREYAVTSDFWVVDRDYVYAGGRPVAAETSAGVRHFHSDHLVSPRVITNGSGSRVAFHTYFPFGEEATDPFQDEERMKFTGHERDLADPNGTGDDLDYMHARFCNPNLARFTAPDLGPTSLKVPQMWNRYSYAVNNPLKFTDPTGEIISLAGLSDTDQNILVASLNSLTGNTYVVDDSGNLAIKERGDSASGTATAFLDDLIGSPDVFDVKAANGTTVAFAANPKGKREVLLDFADFDLLEYGKVAPDAFSPATQLIHELRHAIGEPDPLKEKRDFVTGPVVDFVNLIRAERGLPTRGPAYQGRTVMRNFHERRAINFQNVNPDRPEGIYYVYYPPRVERKSGR